MLIVYSFLGIFVAMDIIGTLPIFLGLTQSFSPEKKTRIIRLSVAVAAAVAFVFVLLGKSIFRFLGIAIYDFKIGGGIVLLLMAILDLVHPKQSTHSEGATGVVPLAVPLITGPGLITTLMLQVGIYGYFVVFFTMTLNFLFAWFILNKSNLVTRVIGVEGTDIVSKIAALLMTAIACSMIRTGIMESIASR